MKRIVSLASHTNHGKIGSGGKSLKRKNVMLMLNYTFQYGVYNVNNILWDPRININLGTEIVFGRISPTN